MGKCCAVYVGFILVLWNELLESNVIFFIFAGKKAVSGQNMLDFECSKCWQPFLQLCLCSSLMKFKETSFFNFH